MDINIEKNYEEYMSLLKRYVTRDGIENLIEWLEHTDIKYAPASSRYGMSCDGGLIQHSLNVFHRLIDNFNQVCKGTDWPYPQEYIVVVALLHEISKVGLYNKVLKNIMGEDGKWRTEPQYVVKPINERFIYASNEENTIYKISKFINLNYEEELAIRWCKPAQDSQSFNRMYEALSVSKLALFMHIAELVEDCTDYGYFNYVVSEEEEQQEETAVTEDVNSTEDKEESNTEKKSDIEIQKANSVLLGENDEYTLRKIGEFETDIPF